MPASCHKQIQLLCAAAQHSAQQHRVPATSGNFSVRHSEIAQQFWLSRSGADKGALSPEDFLHVEADALCQQMLVHHAPLQAKPSAEGLLHAVIYRQQSACQAILHTHSLHSAWCGQKIWQQNQHVLVLQGYELLKGLCGVTTHETVIEVPVLANSQDMPALAAVLDACLHTAQAPVYGFLLAGHGMYVWGSSVAEAQRHAEVLEYAIDLWTLDHQRLGA